MTRKIKHVYEDEIDTLDLAAAREARRHLARVAHRLEVRISELTGVAASDHPGRHAAPPRRMRSVAERVAETRAALDGTDPAVIARADAVRAALQPRVSSAVQARAAAARAAMRGTRR